MGPSISEPGVTIADDFTQVVAHVLAHVALAGPGQLHDPRYLAWAAAHTRAEDRALLDHDAELLARLWAADPRCDRLHAFAELHRDWPGFWACADRALAALTPNEVADPELLTALRELPGAELIHASCALVGPGLRAALAERRAELDAAVAATAAWIERVAVAVPALAGARIELVWALGVHGRALPRRILVGAPVAWIGCSPARQAVLAAHEQAVLEAAAELGGDDYVAEEWLALRRLATQLAEAEPSVRAAHREWLASLELAPLLTELVARGAIDPDAAAALNMAPQARAAGLVRAGP